MAFATKNTPHKGCVFCSKAQYLRTVRKPITDRSHVFAFPDAKTDEVRPTSTYERQRISDLG